ncbi:hypothetical protein CK203_046748 [Vitis vinifera]|uniref:Uncharacterized protein n=1 Tax=Vitis vinifera TaxID=29760 RepID=A0A438D1P0_VITVI|nr:hypothetical protein CK203_108787 [Vitis vinifera]RVW78631.1 hypothetical protein CK203_046748 [Vitis vinifera]
MEEEMFCYIHEGGELVKTAVGSVEYKGGRTYCSVVSKNISHSEFVSKCAECGDDLICPTSGPTPIVASNSAHVSSIGEPPLHISNESPTIESFGFSQRCAMTNTVQLQPSRFEHSIVGSGHTFPNASEF